MGPDSLLNDPKLCVREFFEKKREAVKKKAEESVSDFKKKYDSLTVLVNKI